MPADPGDFLDPVAVARLGRLELVARTLVEGFIKGLHFSDSKGSSTEFSEHRPYVPGDDIRRIDWRAFGKTDRFYLKEYEDETNVRATLFVDASGSMAFQSGEISKFRYATCLAAALGYLLLGQRDAVGLVLAGEDIERHVPPKATPQHLRGIFGAIEAAIPRGKTRLAECIHKLAGRLRARSLVVILSDFIDDPKAVLRSIAHLRHRGCDALLFHVLDPAEEEFPLTRWTVFRDAENPSIRRRLDARQVRQIYRENLSEHLETLRRGCAAAGVDYSLMNTKRPFELALATCLDARERRER